MAKRNPTANPCRPWAMETRKSDHLVIACGPLWVGWDLSTIDDGNRRTYYHWLPTGRMANPLEEPNRFNTLTEAGLYADRLCTALNKANS